MISTRAENVKRNFIWGTAFVAITSIMPFVIRTLLIRCWGLEYVGLNSLFSSILNVLNLSELGLGEALVFNMYKPMAEKEVTQVNALLNVYRKIYTFLGVIILLIGLGLIPFLPKLVSEPYPETMNIVIVYLAYIINTVSGYLIFSYCDAVFQTNQSKYLTYKYNCINYLVMYSAQIAIICLTKWYYCYVYILPIATIAAHLINYRIMKSTYPEYRPLGKIDTSFLNDFVKRVGGMALRKIRTAFRGSIDSVILSSFCGLIIVAKYNNYYLIMTIPMLLIGAIRSAILQSLGNSVAMETVDSNYAVVKLYSFVTQWIGSFFMACLLCFFHPFVELWAGKEAVLSFEAEILFCIYFYVLCITQITDLIRNSTGIWWQGKWIPILECSLNLILDIMLVNRWGIAGVLAATIISMIFINIPCETYCVYKLYFNKSPIRDLLDYLYNFVITIISACLTYRICTLFDCEKIVYIMLRMICCIFLPNLFWMLSHLSDYRLREILRLGYDIIFKKGRK